MEHCIIVVWKSMEITFHLMRSHKSSRSFIVNELSCYRAMYREKSKHIFCLFLIYAGHILNRERDKCSEVFFGFYRIG